MEKTMPGKEKNGGYVVEPQEQEGKPIIVTASGQVIVDRAKDGGNAGVDV